MKISIVSLTSDDPPAVLECDPAMDIGTLKSLIEVETRIPYLRQLLYVSDGPIPGGDQATLKELKIRDGDLITVGDKQHLMGSLSPSQIRPPEEYGPLADQLIDRAGNDAGFRRVLESNQPDLARLVRRRDRQAVATFLRDSWSLRDVDPQAANAIRNPLTPEAQEFMYKQIQQQQIDQNFAMAHEYLPESFGQVAMLYVQIEVNNVPIKAFVDSGAQSTIMSEPCARKCGLERVIDRRYQGLARGVGSAKLTGRIHLAQIKCGDVFFPASFTIIENQQTDILIGLDLLKRHQCCIDLKHNCLRIGDCTSVPFLSEAEVQQSMSDGMLRSLIDTPNESVASSGLGDSTASIPPGVSLVDLTSSRAPWQQAASSAGSRATQTSGDISEDDPRVSALMELGCSKQEAVRALKRCHGNVDLAASTLFRSIAHQN
eukprot:Blabericola_migrator_1__13167@NODE_902_length_6138_cov_137_766595_g632_i0_p1_GENE_NODE_902_length_6138_cov_137_766595_g632_i0NODE_902_length_6138_cov_137_766595_g632_i0_p1_ORF_typecomplete_len431_score89_66Asp_protease/PF09668_10/3_1e50gagasp_proteas/PF13975_6/2_3e14RVP_2/PF08284_11/2e11Asp_protease_2/PF13650_6/5_4e11RVP/PF00077_20/2_4e07Peptidase_A2B/PF12384_8/3_6e07UBA/PF00627_31/1_8e05DUF1758/PF05585_12/0_0022Ubiquitin_2/PF14560_6/0_00062ubiquitin/PF00240_23/0_00096Peptidase_A3/PF02160_15/0_0